MTDAVLAAAPRSRPGILDISPYVAGAPAPAGFDNPAKLSSNENCFGSSDAARAAFAKAQSELHMYPDGSAHELRDVLAEAHGVEAERIICGAGSDEILQLITRAYAGPGDEVLFPQYAFLVYRLDAMQVGATPVAAPETDLRADVDALLEHVTERTRIVFLANPNNPTGSYLPADEVSRLHAGLPGDTLLVLDAAYAEYLDRTDYDAGLELARREANVVMTRTFSKIYGLAGLRLGWAYGPSAVIDVLNRVRGPFNVNAPAQAAALAALGDGEFTRRSKAHNDAQLAWVSRQARDLQLLAGDSVGNFVLLRFPDQPGRTAADADAFLKARGLVLRPVGAYGLADCLRMTIGTEDENRRVVDALRDLMAGA